MAKGTTSLPNKGKGVKATTGSSSATKVQHKDARMASKHSGKCC